MRALSPTGAQHFVREFSATGDSGGGVDDFLKRRAREYLEGTTSFERLRACILRDADRSILLAASNYARALDGLRTSSSYWTLVGLYYSSFFAARALLGMHGCWIGKPDRWVESVSSTPGKQRLAYRRTRYSSAKHVGSHRVTWEAYYVAIKPLKSFVSPPCVVAMDPVNSSPYWMSDLRNRINYEPAAAFALIDDFGSSFDSTNLPGCFPGKFNTAYRVATAFLMLLSEVTANVGLATDVFSPYSTRALGIGALVTAAAPKELGQFAKASYASLEF
jgi:hypothetical protein